MSEAELPLVLCCGERVVCHVVEPSTLAGQIPSLLELYFAPHPVPPGPLRVRTGTEDRVLDPSRPIGDQVPPDAEIHLPAAGPELR